MNQKWVSAVGVVVVLGLALLFGNVFSGTPEAQPAPAPVREPEPAPEAEEEVDFATGVHLRGVGARTSEITTTEGDVMQGVEYQVELELPNRLILPETMNRMEVRAALSGETMSYLGTDQMNGQSFDRREAGPQFSVYLVRLIGFYSAVYEDDKLEQLVTRVGEDVRIALYVDGKKVKDL